MLRWTGGVTSTGAWRTRHPRTYLHRAPTLDEYAHLRARRRPTGGRPPPPPTRAYVSTSTCAAATTRLEFLDAAAARRTARRRTRIGSAAAVRRARRTPRSAATRAATATSTARRLLRHRWTRGSGVSASRRQGPRAWGRNARRVDVPTSTVAERGPASRPTRWPRRRHRPGGGDGTTGRSAPAADRRWAVDDDAPRRPARRAHGERRASSAARATTRCAGGKGRDTADGEDRARPLLGRGPPRLRAPLTTRTGP